MLTVRLNNGVEMPVIGLGVYDPGGPEKTVAAVETAINCGYRLIDTAAAYNNERQVGEGIRRSGINRHELFVTTKLWMSDHGYSSTLRAFDASLQRLGIDYLDLYLIHWPDPQHFEATIAAWRVMADLAREGRVRAIGVSNFSVRHINDLITQSGVRPSVNQVELHPMFAQHELRQVQAEAGIVTESWSPLGLGRALAHPTIPALAAKHGKTAAQIVLRWHIDHGLVAIPKSVTPERIAENIDVFDFALSADDIAAIDAMDTGLRGSPEPDTVHAGTWPVRVMA